MFLQLFTKLLAPSNLILWKAQILGIVALFVSIGIFLTILNKRIFPKGSSSHPALMNTFLRAINRGLPFFAIALSLYTLKRSVSAEPMELFLFWMTFHGVLNLGIAWILFSFSNTVFKADSLNEQQKDSIEKIVKVSHRGINRSIVLGVFVLYTRMMWPQVPLSMKSEYWVIAIVIFNALILSLVLFFAFQRIIPLFVRYLESKKTRSIFLLNLVKSITGPIKILIFSLFLLMIKEFIQNNESLLSFIDILLRLSFSLALLLFLYKMIDSIFISLSKYSESEENSLDKTLFEMLRMISGIVFIGILAIIVIRIITGKELTTLLAGLGIGGLAVALAAQDTLKNFFGSIMIMADKPFKIGERILAEGYDGIIESIGFRSTRIRTLTGNLVVIPNDKVAQIPVENVGKRRSIRRLTNITITYDTSPEKIERALEILRNILENHEGMNEEFPPRIHFNEFNSDSLNIMMIYWYFPPNYWDFLAFTEKVNLQIMREFAAEGIDFAFPTQTTYLEQADGKSIQLSLDNNPLIDK